MDDLDKVLMEALKSSTGHSSDGRTKLDIAREMGISLDSYIMDIETIQVLVTKHIATMADGSKREVFIDET